MTTIDSYITAETFCICGKTIFQYGDWNTEGFIYRENWSTPTGWFHKSDWTFKCKGEFIEKDKDFLIRYFKTFASLSYNMKSIELFNLSV